MEQHLISLKPGLNMVEPALAVPNVSVETGPSPFLNIRAIALAPAQRIEAHQAIPEATTLAIRMGPQAAIDLAHQILSQADKMGWLLPRGTERPRERR